MAAKFDLLKCSSGNLSMRVSDKYAALSSSGSWLGCLQPDQIAICDIGTDDCMNEVKPTMESSFHLGILRCRSDVNFVLHFQSPYATVLACSDPEKYLGNLHNTIEMPAYVGDPAIVECAMPGSSNFAELIIEKFRNKNTNMAILKNHGQICVGVDSRDVIQKAIFFEMNCMISLTSPNLKSLTLDQQNEISELGKA